VNPSLTITALAEYAMSLVPAKAGAAARAPVGARERAGYAAAPDAGPAQAAGGR
jgi:hypothetical protein